RLWEWVATRVSHERIGEASRRADNRDSAGPGRTEAEAIEILQRRNVVQDSVSAAKGGPPIPFHIPHQTDARSEIGEVSKGPALRHAGIAGEGQAGRGIGELVALLSGQEAAQVEVRRAAEHIVSGKVG